MTERERILKAIEILNSTPADCRAVIGLDSTIELMDVLTAIVSDQPVSPQDFSYATLELQRVAERAQGAAEAVWAFGGTPTQMHALRAVAGLIKTGGWLDGFYPAMVDHTPEYIASLVVDR